MPTELELRIPCSPEQEEVIADHLLFGQQLGMQPDERAWIVSRIKKQYPTAKVIAADLDLANAEWVVTVTTPLE